MGIRGSPTVAMHLSDCAVPVEQPPGRGGQGFSIAMATLDRSRPAIGGAGGGHRAGRARRRRRLRQGAVQFGQPIAGFQGIQFMLADMAMQVRPRGCWYHAAARVDARRPRHRLEAAWPSASPPTRPWRSTTDAVQVFGGYGYIREYPVESFMRDAKITQIYEGTNQIQRVVIARDLLGAR